MIHATTTHFQHLFPNKVGPDTPEVNDDSDGKYPFYHIPLLSIIWSDSPAHTELKKTILLCNEWNQHSLLYDLFFCIAKHYHYWTLKLLHFNSVSVETGLNFNKLFRFSRCSLKIQMWLQHWVRYLRKSQPNKITLIKLEAVSINFIFKAQYATPWKDWWVPQGVKNDMMHLNFLSERVFYVRARKRT